MKIQFIIILYSIDAKDCQFNFESKLALAFGLSANRYVNLAIGPN